MKKRLVSFFLALIFILSVIPISVSAITISEFDSLVSSFQNNRYPHNSTYKDNALYGGYECFGFANELATYIFGSFPTNSMSAATVNSGWSITYGGGAVDSLSVGDIVRYHYHSIFITAIDGDNIYYAQANVPSGTNKVTYNNHITRASLKSKVSERLTSANTTKNGWVAHFNNGLAPSSSPSYIQDVRYPILFRGYTYVNAKQPAYDAVNGNNIGNIYTTDELIVQAVYTNGWVKALCPWSGYSNGREIYFPLSTLVDVSYTPKTATATAKTQCYSRNDLATSLGYIYVDDVCVIVGEVGDYYQLLCPWDWGYYLVWGHKSAFAHSHSFGAWTNYNTSCHFRTCSCGAEEWQDHSWNSGVVSRQATCTSVGEKIYTCTVCGGTKTEVISQLQHSYTFGTYTESAHPHGIYNTCVCGARQHSGRNASIVSCAQCYPAPIISNIVSSKDDIFVGDTVTFTLNATGATEYCIAIGDGVNVLLEKKQATNAVAFTFAKEGIHHIWGYAYNGEVYSASPVLTITVEAVTLSSVSVATMPLKTTYELGEAFDASGLGLKLTYNNGITKTIADGFEISGFNSDKAGVKTITVSYEGKTVNFDVIVMGPKKIEAVANSIYEVDKVIGTILVKPSSSSESLAGFMLNIATDREYIQVVDTNGNVVTNVARLTTGYSVQLLNYDKTVINTYTIVILGDCDGSGRISATDTSFLKKLIKTRPNSNTIEFLSGDIDGNGKVGATDVARLRSFIKNSEW